MKDKHKQRRRKQGARKRWLHSKVTCSEVYVHGQWRHAEVKVRPGQTWHQWGQDRKILWQKDLLSQTKKTINLRNKKIWRTKKKKLKHHGNSINTFKKLPFTTSDNYWYLWKLSIAVTELIMDMHTLHVDLSFFNASCEIFLELSG